MRSPSQPITIVDLTQARLLQLFRPGTPSQVDSLTFTTNPKNIICGYGYSYVYTAIFALISQPSPAPSQTDAIVIVMPTTGGTVTTNAGIYTYSNGSVTTIQAIPESGYQFSYWVVSSNYTPGHCELQNSVITDEAGTVIGVVPRVDVSGIDSMTFKANPAKITCEYGYTYTSAAFAKTEAATSTPKVQPTASPTSTATRQ